MKAYRYFLFTLLFVIAGVNQISAQMVKAYAGEDNHIDVIDVDNMTVIKTIEGAAAYRMVLTPDGKKLYTTDHNYEMQVIDAEADTLIKSFDPSYGEFSTYELEGIAVSPDGKRIYVSDEYETTIFVIDTEADTVLFGAYLNLDEPEDLVVSPDGQFLYVNDNTSVSKIRTDSLIIVAQTQIDNDGHGVTLSSDGTKVYAEGRYNGVFGVVVLDADSLAIDTAMTASGYHLKTSLDGSYIFGVNESRKFSVMDVAADTVFMEMEYATSSGLRGISETPDGNYILLAGSNGLIKLDATTYNRVDSTGTGYRAVTSKYVTPTTIGDNGSALVPASLELYANYPNPFNPSTTIRFKLLTAAHVTMKLYNVNGQLIETLINENRNAGLQAFSYDASHLASGVYYYRIQAGRDVKTRSMILVR